MVRVARFSCGFFTPMAWNKTGTKNQGLICSFMLWANGKGKFFRLENKALISPCKRLTRSARSSCKLTHLFWLKNIARKRSTLKRANLWVSQTIYLIIDKTCFRWFVIVSACLGSLQKFLKESVTRRSSSFGSASLSSPRALTIWMGFLVVLSGQTELYFFALRDRNRLNCIIWSEVLDASGPRSGYISTRNQAAKLPVVLDVLSDDLEYYFFGRRRRRFHLFSCCRIQISSVKPAIRGPTHGRKNTTTDHKTSFFSPVELQLCSKTSVHTTDEKRQTLHR